MSDILARICADTREEVARRKRVRSFADVMAAARQAPPPRGFAAALSAAPDVALITEIKRGSPSRGIIRPDFDPPALARAYAAGGAACLSVLTDSKYFHGADAHLGAARAAVPLPVLRKDFMLEPYQIAESRAIGADCVLLIMAAIDDGAAAEMEALVSELGMDVLVEVHDEAELERALRLRSPLIGVNNRNLKTLAVDLATTERLAPLLPPDRDLVCESGVHDAADIARMRRIGARRFLVGESLLRQDDITAAVGALLTPAAPARASA